MQHLCKPLTSLTQVCSQRKSRLTDILPLAVVIETARLAAVHSYGLTVPGSQATLDEIAISLAKLYNTAFALISLVDANTVRVAAQVGLPTEPASRFGAFCHYVIAEPSGSLVVRDTTLDARFHMSPLVRSAPRIRTYAGVALVDYQGYALGAVGVLHTSPLAAADLPIGGLVRASACALASLQAERARLASNTGPVAKHTERSAEQRDVQTTVLSARALWIGIRTEESGRLPWNLGPGRTIRRVAENSPASRAGLRVGDVLLDIDGHATRGRNDIEDRFFRHRAGDVIQLRVLRGWRRHSFRVRLDIVPLEKRGQVDGDEARCLGQHGASPLNP